MDLKKIITDAHMAGQHNQGVDASWSEAHAYYTDFIKTEKLAMCEANSNAVLSEVRAILSVGICEKDYKYLEKALDLINESEHFR